jgi:hypothetical protein
MLAAASLVDVPESDPELDLDDEEPQPTAGRTTVRVRTERMGRARYMETSGVGRLGLERSLPPTSNGQGVSPLRVGKGQ